MSNNSEKETEKKDGIQTLIETGAEIAGGAVGGALGFLAGGPIGAALLGAGGAAAAMALKHVSQEVSERLLGHREEVRIGAVLAIAAGEIRQRIENGESVRNDDFFDMKQTRRSDAEEVVESILLKSQREPEEKKLQYMGHLLSSIAFDQKIGVHMAHQIIKEAEQLTYRQLCVLKLAVVKDSFGLRNGDYRGQKSFSIEVYQVLFECLGLYHKGYLNFGRAVVFGPTDIKPGSMTTQGLGAEIY
ncbi:MAG: hypothetical protein NPIRA02_14570 [Nitrospirales bacterium]|nr:MAG: hypothetical protein NPIRA02_14570 [Nitrospirales bacterium]